MTAKDLKEIKSFVKEQSLNYFNSEINVNKRIITHDLRDIGLDFMCCYDIVEDKYQFFVLTEVPKGEIKTHAKDESSFNYVEQAVFETSSPFTPIEEKLVDLKNITIQDILSITNADLIAWFMERVDLAKIMSPDLFNKIDSCEVKGSLYNLYRLKDDSLFDNRNGFSRRDNAIRGISFIEYWCPTSNRHYIQPSTFNTVKEHLCCMNAGIDFAEEGIAFQI